MQDEVKANDTVERTIEYINEVMEEAKDVEARLPKHSKEDGGLESIVDSICDSSHRIGIEFECGDCCKKVTNGFKLFIACDSIILLPAQCESLVLRVFCCGKIVDKQLLKAIIIPLEKLCSIEIQKP